MKTLVYKYFNSSISETPFELLDHGICAICQSNDSYCIELDGSVEIISKDAQTAEVVCLDCLNERKYGFEHQVEGGFITSEGVVTESDKYSYLKNGEDYASELRPKEEVLLKMSPEQLDDLIHTPPFNAFQGAIWLIHCNDFMQFIGTWEHEDFVKYAPNGDAKAYFNEIVDNWNGDEFYDKQFGPNKSEYAESVFYAFKCVHCEQHRGYVE